LTIDSCDIHGPGRHGEDQDAREKRRFDQRADVQLLLRPAFLFFEALEVLTFLHFHRTGTSRMDAASDAKLRSASLLAASFEMANEAAT
jgi:hypothetical protein